MEKLVPLRKPFDCKQVLPANSGGTTRVTFEVFYAPQGTALVANVIIVVRGWQVAYRDRHAGS